MLKQLIENKKELHSRDIRLKTFAHKENQIIVEGVLKDMRNIKIYQMSGEEKTPGIVHHMAIQLLIQGDPLVIKDAEAQMLKVPEKECRQTLDTIEKIKGIQIKSGLTQKIHNIMGGKRGCTHLHQLLTAMIQEIVQGWLSHKRKERSPVPTSLKNFKDKAFLVDSCRMWTPDGPRMLKLKA
ncbi:MAG: DUF2889 domain-containing protein, partial [Desulfobacteraceae bacterium]|nr:DUF2889 domain-containing protein [Desulfobacteraceae bacterium]